MIEKRIIKKQRERYAGYTPSMGQPLRKPPIGPRLMSEIRALRPQRAGGDESNLGITFTGNRFSRPLPTESKGPIRARATRQRKGADGY